MYNVAFSGSSPESKEFGQNGLNISMKIGRSGMGSKGMVSAMKKKQVFSCCILTKFFKAPK